MAVPYEFGSPECHAAVAAAGRKAFQETLEAGLPVFYIDEDGIDAMLCPDGRKFEIRWIPGAPSGQNYEIVGELKTQMA